LSAVTVTRAAHQITAAVLTGSGLPQGENGRPAPTAFTAQIRRPWLYAQAVAPGRPPGSMRASLQRHRRSWKPLL